MLALRNAFIHIGTIYGMADISLPAGRAPAHLFVNLITVDVANEQAAKSHEAGPPHVAPHLRYSYASHSLRRRFVARSHSALVAQ